jgi:hypothetical protein
MNKELEKAIKYFGGIKETAYALRVARSDIDNYKSRGYVPLKHVFSLAMKADKTVDPLKMVSTEDLKNAINIFEYFNQKY